MKMSEAMKLCGYGGLPNGKELIEEQAVRENSKPQSETTVETQNTRKPVPTWPDFTFFVQRDFSDQEIELAIEVRDYQPPDKRHYYGCEYFPGSVEFGDAHTLDGKEFTMTPLELEAAKAAFWNL